MKKFIRMIEEKKIKENWKSLLTREMQHISHFTQLRIKKKIFDHTFSVTMKLKRMKNMHVPSDTRKFFICILYHTYVKL